MRNRKSFTKSITKHSAFTFIEFSYHKLTHFAQSFAGLVNKIYNTFIAISIIIERKKCKQESTSDLKKNYK